jgi:hypothetical protein
MRCQNKYLLILVFFFSKNIYAQPFLPTDNDYSVFIENAEINSLNFHSEIKPYNLAELKLDTSKINFFNYKFYTNNQKISCIPIIETQLSNSINNDFGINFSIGAEIKAKINKNLYFQINLSENLNKFPSYIIDKIDSNKIIPHWGRNIDKLSNFYNYPSITGLISFNPRPYFSFILGYDKNFIGDGYRSMFLSDNSAPYPFAKLTINAWHIKYFAMLASFSDVNTSQKGIGLSQKYGIFHYFSLNATNRLTLGFYENIIWQVKDSGIYRGIELAYLNPVIFYRPLEDAINSPDNANIGVSGKIRLWKKTFLYGQFYLDDIVVKEISANKGWWGNKYGMQTGIKSFNPLGIEGAFIQAEYNFVRPYTYSHISSLTNFGNMYQALADPLGANFYELIEIIKYRKNKWWIDFKSTEALFGNDIPGKDFGKNIYLPYNLRIRNYGNYTTQGVKTSLITNEISFNYLILPKWNLAFQTGYKLYYSSGSPALINDNYFFIGISTLLYNNDIDY